MSKEKEYREALELIRNTTHDALAAATAFKALESYDPCAKLRRERDEAIAAANASGFEVEELKKKIATLECSCSHITAQNQLFGLDFLYPLGAEVEKKSGASWQGKICGFYHTELTLRGYVVESSFHKNSVQIYPQSALELIK